MTINCFKQKLLVVSILLICIGFVANAQVGQSNFRYLNPKQFGFTSLYMSFVDNNNGLAVGANGSIAKTTDGGKNWQYGVFKFQTASGYYEAMAFQDVHFVTPTIAYAVGDSGLCAKTVDGGVNWTLIKTPLYNSQKSINAVWFTSANVGYIGGQPQVAAFSNAVGSVITTNMDDPNTAPKLYFTKDGGTTWDSLNAPIGDLTVTGMVANPSYPPLTVPISSSGKTIYRIKFVNDSTGYVIGGTNTVFERVQNAATTTTSSTGNYCPIVWKFTKGVLKDYSPSKEKLGYTGIVTATPTTTTTYNGSQYPTGQNYKAFMPINDSAIVMVSFNNMQAIRISTGLSDSTSIPLVQAAKISGKYEVVHYAGGAFGTTAIPANAADRIPISSNVVSMDKLPNGDIYFTLVNGQVGYTKTNGNTWGYSPIVPISTNNKNAQLYAMKALPNGKLIVGGAAGMIADSLPGPSASNYYNASPGKGLNYIDFADCFNGAAVGANGSMLITTDGGKSWVDKTIASFASGNIGLSGIVYQSPTKMYFTAGRFGFSNIYSSSDKGTTNDLLFQDPLASAQGGIMNGIAVSGNRIWAVGHRNSAPLERTVVFRSFDAGLTWDTAKANFPTGTNAANFSKIFFPTPDTGYIAGTNGKVFRTIDGGLNWTDISPIEPGAVGGGQLALGVYDKNTIYFWTLSGINRYLYKSTNAGATWTRIAQGVAGYPDGNLTSFTFHDANNITAFTGGRTMYSNDGGNSWNYNYAPIDNFSSMAWGVYVPKVVPAGTPITSRRLVIAGNGSNILEYGAPMPAALASTEVITGANCATPNGGSIVSTATGGVTPYSFSLDGGNFLPSGTFTGLASGNHTLIIKEAYGCETITKTINVGFTNNLTVTATPIDTLVCTGVPLTLKATANLAGSTYAWSPAAGLSATNISNPVATVFASTLYTVTASLNGCTATATSNVRTKPTPLVTVSPKDTLVCAGQQFTLQANSLAGTTYAWSPSTNLSAINIANPVVTANNTILYTVATSLNGCTSSATSNVNIKLNPIINAGPDKTILSGEAVILEGSGPNGAQSILWTPSTALSNASIYNPVATPTATTTYTLIVKDYNSCTATDNMLVTVIQDCIKPMEAFTPNGDGINEYWLISTSNSNCLTTATATVFNRYGAKVFESKDYKNNWNGTYNGKPLPDGTYYYIITYTLINGKGVEKKGNVTILR